MPRLLAFGARVVHSRRARSPSRQMPLHPSRGKRMRLLCRTTMAALITLSPLSVAAAQTGVIAGRVTNATTNTPVPRANVQAFVGPERRAATTADENGLYRLSELAEGRYTISVLRVGQAVRRIENVVVRANQTTT